MAGSYRVFEKWSYSSIWEFLPHKSFSYSKLATTELDCAKQLRQRDETSWPVALLVAMPHEIFIHSQLVIFSDRPLLAELKSV